MDVRRRIVGRKPAGWHGGDRIGDAGVPEKIIFRMMDQEAVVRDVDRLAYVHTNRPARPVGGVSLAAVETITTVHALPGRLGPGCACQKKYCDGSNDHIDSLHGMTSVDCRNRTDGLQCVRLL